jgi:predicted aconitase with swiveling domain
VTESSGRAYDARVLVGGEARGEALVLDEPLSYWGGVDPGSGRVIDPHHPQAGEVVTGRVLIMPSGRGSSSSSSVLAEAIRAGTAPAATVLLHADEIIALGALVARELYGVEHPVLVLEVRAHGSIRTGDVVAIATHESSGRVTVIPRSPGRRASAP